MKVKEIKNFLEKEDFKILKDTLISYTFPWYLNKVVDLKDHQNQLTHLFYKDLNINSSFYNLVLPIVNKIKPISIVRIKANLLFKTDKIIEHGFHTDVKDTKNFIHTGILYINTNNGYTKFKKDNLKISSEENKFVCFNSSDLHTGSTCTDEEVRILVAGGDGSIMWAFNEIFAHGIDVEKVSVGVLPFGTGNDFSRVTGWGGGLTGPLIGQNLSKLKIIVDKYVKATVHKFDLWNVEIEVFSDGRVQQIKKGKKVPIDLNHTHPISGNCILKKLCGNYFSIGVESRVGLGFDKRRTPSVTRNKLIYAREGFKKMTVTKTILNNDLIESCHIPANPMPDADDSWQHTHTGYQTTEILQEGVMIFVNEIAEIVHGTINNFSGAANKNIGDAFLIFWKLPTQDVRTFQNNKING
jgi:hypothetical protein